LDSEVVWIFTEPSAILVMSTSLLRMGWFFLFKEAYFYAGWLPVTSRCASRGKCKGIFCILAPNAIEDVALLLNTLNFYVMNPFIHPRVAQRGCSLALLGS
jgi:hypothetical protein